MFAAIQEHWTGERWIRVTDDDGLAQFIGINQTKDENGQPVVDQNGNPAIMNALGSVDVDIILDEGPDTINAQADVYETLSQVLPAVANMLTPPQAQAAVKVLLDTSALPSSAKKDFRAASQPQQDPMAEQAKQIQLAGEAAKVDETKSKTMLNMAKAHETAQPEMGVPAKPEKYELPPEIQNAKAIADINHTQAQAHHINTQAELAPIELLHDTAHKIADREQQAEAAKRQAQQKVTA